ncbi:two-component system, response regulator YesN [Paenibacillus sp. 1_12]|uniref:response regulator transcription factor n=1 Tax=Paenibacillus sp. 1_12 TaxID=1566278 RepID=UPI0008EFF83E|nr:response regulator [Paenibacillus sp. 1_12]SFL66337.1 two-component system, response regulator YesN [Paenibacillus sp. 1_12]
MLKGKVLIVEDQPNFRMGLTKMFEEGQLGWQVVGEAGNGQAALELLDQVKPDLVLTDIRMPIMDGIEFVGHLRQHYPDMLVVILTGYKNFEYAQAAVRLGALDLLIKPCTEQDVNQVMSKAYERFYEKYALLEKQQVQHKQQQEQELCAVLLDLPSPMGISKSLDNMLMGQELWLLKWMNENTPIHNYGKNDMSLLQFAFSNIVEELLKEAGIQARLLLVEHDRFVLISESAGLNVSLKAAIRDASLQYLKIRIEMISMGDAPAAKHLAALYNRFKGLDNESAGLYAATEGESGYGMKLSSNQARVKELEVQLMSAILMGQEDSLQKLLDRLIKELSSQSHEEMKIGALSLSIALLGTIHKQFDPDENSLLAKIPSDIPEAHWTPDEVTRWASEQVKNFLLLFNNWQALKNDNLMERAVKYIEEHYNEACRLTDVAAHVHLNASYFSVLFKKTVGESFTRFVTRTRMDKAALLLRNTDMKIFEIACAVGFDEPNYFTNVFKQQYQMTPKEYRNYRDPG